jgi:hypothetical protein
MRSNTRAALLAVAMLLPASPAFAQVGSPAAKTGFAITPYLGVLIPTKDLLDYSSSGNVPTKLGVAITFGARVGIGIGSHIGIEGDLGYSPGSLEFSSTGTAVNQDVKVWTGSGRLTLYLIPRTSPLWLGISGGVGGTRHSFSQNGYSGPSDIKPGTNVGAVLGASAGIRLGRIIAFNFGAEDYLYNASFDVNGTKTAEKKQHDIRLTAGVRVPFLGF